ncbi:MAG: AsmA family protein [Gammaproteobacteria bacterium]|uniref:AsmA family protein n=1 Tax=Candidatus Kutchimonas denitrificans TaxID=3056748 RepID=A0AAE4ZCG0_9BACT|nr:AsmA family protein [Gemmatimonadota bacterium]NIR75130.1 AsmA family protein [Candidatus Kutchimonas denitrificans]NIU52940.1 AsmA family protein [Gemmatimonadota bacterium]NIV52409.1 AsmA family protein [Gammaproteobacteria bacterium]NIY44829.1 AsmA family protein [Gemmatimonadota bacterium]
MNTESNGPTEGGRKLPVPHWLIVTAGAVTFLIVGGAVALKLAFPPEKLRALVVPRIEEEVGREVELASVRLKVFPRIAVRLDELAVANAPGFGPEPTFELEALELDLRIWPLILRRELELGEVRIVRPLIRYQVRADGTSNFEGLGPADTSDAPPAGGEGQATDDPAAAAAGAFFVSDLRLIDGTVLYSNARDARHARMALEAQAAVERSATGPGTMEGRGTIDVRSITALAPALGEDSVALPDLRIEYDVFADLGGGGDSLIVHSLLLDVGEFPLSGAGSVRQLSGDRTIDFAIESSDVDIGRLLASLPPALAARLGAVEAAGTAKLAVTASGAAAAEDGPRIEGTLTVDDVEATHAEHGQLLSGGAGRLTFTRTTLAIPEFDAQLWGRPFSLQLAVSDFETMVARGKVSGALDLARAAALRDAPVPVNGTAAYDIEFAGPIRDIARLRLTGPIALDRVSYQSEALTVPAVVSEATLRLTGDGLSAEGIPVRMGGSDLTISLSAPGLLAYALSEDESAARPEVEFGITSEKLNLGELLPETEEVGYGGLVAARLAGKRVDGREPGELAREKYPLPPLPPVNARGRVRIAQLINPPTRINNLSFNVRARDGVIELLNLEGRAYGGRITGSASLDASGGLPPFPLEYDLNLQDANAGGVVQRWTRLGAPISGQLDFALKGSGAIDETMLPAPQALAATGNARFLEGAFNQEFPITRALVNRFNMDPNRLDFQNFGGAFEIRGGNFVLDTWQLAGGDVSASIGGVAGLGGALDLQVQLKLPMATLREAGLAQGAGLGEVLNQLAGSDEAIDLSIGVGGDMSDPQLRLDTEALQQELARRMQGQGRGLLERLLRPPPDTGGVLKKW